MAINCNYDKNYKLVYIDGMKVGSCQEFTAKEENEISEEAHFDGIDVDNLKFPKTTITISRLISYDPTKEAQLSQLLKCMQTDPKTITFIEQKSTPAEDGSMQISRTSRSYKNCRISSREESFKAEERSKMDLEFKSEGLITDKNNPIWSVSE